MSDVEPDGNGHCAARPIEILEVHPPLPDCPFVVDGPVLLKPGLLRVERNARLFLRPPAALVQLKERTGESRALCVEKSRSLENRVSGK